jgi:hypothetical protein
MSIVSSREISLAYLADLSATRLLDASGANLADIAPIP